MKYRTTGPVGPTVFLGTLIAVMEEARKVVPKMRAGFCFGVFDRHSGDRILSGIIGKVRDFKLSKYEKLVEEKAARLFIQSIDACSYESRNADSEKYGGAVRGKDYVLSISGLASEHQDEAIGMKTLILLEQLKERFAKDIAEQTGNRVFRQILGEAGGYDGGRTGGER